MTAPAGLQRFHASNRPPTPPQSKNFQFEETTVFIECDEPHEIGNSILDYMASHVDSSVTKVTPTKCSFKSEVFVDGVVACTLKVRIHRKATEIEGDASQSRQYAVRFQRRSGCAFVFHNVFTQIRKYLLKNFTFSQGEPDDDSAGWLANLTRQADWKHPPIPNVQPLLGGPAGSGLDQEHPDLPVPHMKSLLNRVLSDIPDLPDDFELQSCADVKMGISTDLLDDIPDF